MIQFVDNEGTQFSLRKGFSENQCVDVMAEAFASLECCIHVDIWIGIMPSKRDVADSPSKGIVNVPLLEDAEDVSTIARTCLGELVTQIMKLGEMAA